MLNSTWMVAVHGKARQQELLAEAERSRRCRPIRPHLTTPPTVVALIRTLIDRVRSLSGGRRGSLPADGSWSASPNAGV